MWRKMLLVVFGIAIFTVERVSAAESWKLPLDESNWSSIKVPGTLENAYSIGNGLLTVRSDKSASFRYFELPTALRNPKLVNWRWRVESFSSVSRQGEKGRDDRPLAVHLWFNDTGGGSLFGGVASIFGYPKVGHLLTYVWGAEDAAGSIIRNPYYAKGRVIVLVGQNAPTGQWRSVQRDIARDFKAAFGSAGGVPSLRYIAVSADNDDLGGRSFAALKSLSIVLP